MKYLNTLVGCAAVLGLLGAGPARGQVRPAPQLTTEARRSARILSPALPADTAARGVRREKSRMIRMSKAKALPTNDALPPPAPPPLPAMLPAVAKPPGPPPVVVPPTPAGQAGSPGPERGSGATHPVAGAAGGPGPGPPAAEGAGFPWPPPPYSAQADLPDSLLRGAQTLGDANDRLTRTLRRYQSRRYYELPEGAGFALVTRFEQINKSCKSLAEPARWNVNTVACPEFTPQCLVNLAFPSAGRWRVFVFVVTDRPLPAPRGQRPGSAQAQAWFGEGTNRLSRKLRRLPFTAEHYGTVLVYEFEKRECCEVVLLTPSPFEGLTHLRRAGILP